jgi:osomolarity two-component system sensor histidine kinase SLN1
MNKKLRVLIVDNAPEILAILSELFKGEGFEVVTAVNGHDALAKYDTHMERNAPFNLVSLDIVMPDIQGPELAAQLRSHGYGGPMVAFSGFPSFTMKKKVVDNGVSAYFNKKVISPSLIKAIRERYC